MVAEFFCFSFHLSFERRKLFFLTISSLRSPHSYFAASSRDPTTGQARRRHLPTARHHLVPLPARDPGVQDLQLRLQSLPHLLLLDLVGARGLWLLSRPGPFHLEADPVSGDGSGRRVQRLDVLVGCVGGTQKHPVRLDAAHVSGLEVAERDDGTALHLLDGDEFHEPRDDGPGFRVAQVDGLDVEAVVVWV